MNFSLTPELEIFVRDRASSGEYNNASEVVREAIRMLKRSDDERAEKMKWLKSAIKQGDDAIDQGESSVFNSEADLDAFFESL